MRFAICSELCEQADFFNVFNAPRNEFSAGGDGIVSYFTQRNSPRQLQLSGRLTW
jgi:hypothetical protein